jgi:hypothetical protein
MTDITTLLDRLKSIDGYPFDILKDAPLITTLANEFPDVDFNEELARLGLWLSDIRPGPRIHYRLLLRKWIVNASRRT